MSIDTIVVGAGIAGSAAAIRLARAGQRVALIDRERGATHKVCGEFLSGPATAHLRALGLDPAALGGQRIEGLRLVAGAREAEAALPFEAWGLARFVLDTALRERAAEAGAELRLGFTVRRVEDSEVVLGRHEHLMAERIVLATGKHDLAGRRRTASGARPMIGFKQHLRLRPAAAETLGGRIELHFFAGGYAGLQPVGDGVANLSLVIDEPAFAAAGRSFEGVIAAVAPGGSILAERLAGHEALWPKPLAVSGVPYGFRLWRAPPGPDWLWPIGDQAAVIPSFTGDGMAIAMASAEQAATAILSGASPAEYRAAIRSRASRQLKVAGSLDALAATSGFRTIALAAVSAAPILASFAAKATRIGGPAHLSDLAAQA